ncbi:hypothetical protein F5Y17DRAFT_227814 [Xylariaceae sp. FL0594]|nr:hypothetical protein F5Y17DRAFT_227814 [Xylariaceae sp. FL0594]
MSSSGPGASVPQGPGSNFDDDYNNTSDRVHRAATAISTAAIVGIVIAAVVFVVSLCLIIWGVRRMRLRRRGMGMHQPGMPMGHNMQHNHHNDMHHHHHNNWPGGVPPGNFPNTAGTPGGFGGVGAGGFNPSTNI